MAYRISNKDLEETYPIVVAQLALSQDDCLRYRRAFMIGSKIRQTLTQILMDAIEESEIQEEATWDKVRHGLHEKFPAIEFSNPNFHISIDWLTQTIQVRSKTEVPNE